MREYVPIFFDWVEVTGELNAQEKGRLIDAIVLYAQGGDWQEQIKGNERYLFPAFRKQIDRANEISENKSAAATAREQSRAQKSKQTTIDHNATQASTKTTTEHKIPNNNKEENKENNKEEKEKRERSRASLDLFNQFWEAYPRKIAKQDAVRAWGKLKADEAMLQTILTAIERQKASPQWQKDNGEFIPHPATWLNGHRWEDEVITGKPKQSQIAQTNYSQREYEDTKPGELPDWYLKMLEDEKQAEATEKAGVTPEAPQWRADMVVEEAME